MQRLASSCGRAFAALLVTVGLGSACSDSSGILIEVSRDNSVSASIDELRFFVGTDQVANDPSAFVDAVPDQAIALGGRDLARDPYSLLLHPTGSIDEHVMVAVLARHGQTVVGFGALAEPVHFFAGKTVMWPITLAKAPDGLAVDVTGCLRWFDAAGNPMQIGQPPDRDCDGYGADDCNDLDPKISPGQSEICGNSIDDDCDQKVDENSDDDKDGVKTCDGDCDDTNAHVYPGAPELCDGVDNDCDGACDEPFDQDGDRFTTCGSRRLMNGSCLFNPARFTDCDDTAPQTHPGADELCDGRDNDCNGQCDDAEELDPDGDGYTSCGSVPGAGDVCGPNDAAIDCAPDDMNVHPGAVELCDGKDDNCDGTLLEQGDCFAFDPNVPANCYAGLRPCDDTAAGAGAWTGACVPTVVDGAQVDPGLCDAYAQCDQAGNPDPYTCAVAAATTASVDCTVDLDVVGLAQCAQHLAVLPSAGAGNCSYEVVGGVDQGDYVVGFLAPGDLAGTPQAQLDQCAAVLSVVPRAGATIPQPTTVLVRIASDAGASFGRITIGPATSPTCNPPDGLECMGLAAP